MPFLLDLVGPGPALSSWVPLQDEDDHHSPRQPHPACLFPDHQPLPDTAGNCAAAGSPHIPHGMARLDTLLHPRRAVDSHPDQLPSPSIFQQPERLEERSLTRQGQRPYLPRLLCSLPGQPGASCLSQAGTVPWLLTKLLVSTLQGPCP